VVGYVALMLGYSTVYQVTVKLRLWRLSFETAEFSGLQALEKVEAAGVPSPAFGEGLADALDIGGLLGTPVVSSGQGTFYCGTTSARHGGSVELDRAALLVRAAEGYLLARWPYGHLERLSAHDGLLRLGRAGSPVLARLEISDPELATEIDARAASVDRS